MGNQTNRMNVFRKFSILSYEDKETIHKFASHLFKLQPIKAFRVLYWWFANESFRFSPVRIYENYQSMNFDKKYNTDTSRRAELPALTIDSPNIDHGVYYQASPVSLIRQNIRQLTINYGDYVFIDFGSGKGRVLLLASEFPFKQVIGIEFSQELHEIAINNIKNYKPKKCNNVQSICIDATEYKLPPENIVLYFYNPFDNYILSKIIQNVKKAIHKYHKNVYILFYHLANPEILNSSPEFQLVKKGNKFYIYKAHQPKFQRPPGLA